MQRFNMLRVPDEIGATPPFVLGSLYRFSAPNPERSKIRSRVGERALGRDLMRVLLRIITAYGERRPAELLLRFGRQGPVFIPDRTLTFLIGRQ